MKAFGCSFRTTANAVLRARGPFLSRLPRHPVKLGAFPFECPFDDPCTRARVRDISFDESGKIKGKGQENARNVIRTRGETRGAARDVPFPLNATTLCFCTKVVASNFALNKETLKRSPARFSPILYRLFA